MKKIMILAVAAVALAACSRTFDTAPVAQAEIGFGTWNGMLTKHTQGLSSSDAGFAWANGDKFTVTGYKTNSSTPTVIFDNVEVTYSTSTSAWSYEQPRYWDYSASEYVFYAVSPMRSNPDYDSTDPDSEEYLPLIVLDSADGSSEAASASVTFGGADSDILVANETPVAPGAFGNTVNLAFNHAASLLDLKVKKDSQLDDAQVDIISISITTMGNTGTFEIDSYTSHEPVITWSNPTAYTGTYTNTSGVTSVATLPTDIDSSTASDLISKLIVLPQTFNDTDNIQKIVISYRITDKNGTPNDDTDDIVNTYPDKELPLYLFDEDEDRDNDDTPIGSFAPGVHYVFTLTINAKIITFSASVNNWDTAVNGYGYLVN